MYDSKDINKAHKALQSLATGMKVLEITEEFVMDEQENELKLQKKRIVTKNLPPDLEAYKLLYGQEFYDEYSDEQLEKEKQRLLKQLLELEKKEKKNENK